MRLLLISNSTNAGEEYLQHPTGQMKQFLGGERLNCLFIPYAGVTISFDAYEERVKNKFDEIGHNLESIHHYSDPVEAVQQADAIITGGGNTFQLIKMLHDHNLITPIREAVLEGKPYMGWSAGANVACPTICTTNDMPIVEPRSFAAFNLVSFQINPHYLDANPDGHAGETREMRIEEFLEVNRTITVAGLREGTMFWIENGKVNLLGSRDLRIFKHGELPREYKPGDKLDFLL
jgi:dipeptidase E